jgi:CspA family cold shock protein
MSSAWRRPRLYFLHSTYNFTGTGLCPRRYQSQIDGYWRFAALFPSLSLLLAIGLRCPEPQQKEIDMPNGTVKFFNDQKGFGFIAPDDGSGDTFVHASAVERAGFHSLQQNQRVAYEVVQGQRGKSEAANLRLIEEGQDEQDNAPTTAESAE